MTDAIYFEVARSSELTIVLPARAFAIGDGNEPTLLPVIDMANHDAANPAARIEKTEAGEFQVGTARFSLELCW